MILYSTNGKVENSSLKDAIFKGLPADNGLYMPTSIPKLPADFFERLDFMSFPEIAFEVSKALVGDDIPADDLEKLVFDAVNFDAPLVQIEENVYVLELFHGPSMAFKDFGARFMSRVMSYFLQKENKEINILVATSGDTGSAVAQGFLGMPGIKVTILYPSGKVSVNQEKQLTTLGQNITALEIDGVFDDCQALVKQAFLDEELNKKLNLSSANSINIARLIPQSFYYFYAYAQLKALEQPIVFSVPSGNFGNLCGGLIAQKMGLPVEKFVAATNSNNIMPEYIRTGVFSPKPSVATISNAMDVGNPSNYPRVVALHDGDYNKVKKNIVGKYYTDAATAKAVLDVFKETEYIMCPHTAVAYLGLKEYLKESKSAACGVLLSTADPAKFDDIVEPIIKTEVPMPDRLKETITKEKQSIKMSKDFADFKAFLMK